MNIPSFTIMQVLMNIPLIIASFFIKFFGRMGFSTLDEKVTIGWIVYVLKNPTTIALIGIGGYLLIIILTSPLYFLSFLITGYGSLCLSILGVVLLARSFGRTMSYPGSSKNVQREVAIDYLKRVCAQLLQTLKQASIVVNNLKIYIDFPDDNKNHEQNLIYKIKEIQSIPPYLYATSQMISLATEALRTKGRVSKEDLNDFETFHQAIHYVGHCVQLLLKVINTNQNTIDISQQEVFHACCKSIEDLFNMISAIIPNQIASDDYVAQFTDFIKSARHGCQHYELLVFPLMIQHLVSNFKAELLTVDGADGNAISCAWLPTLRPKSVGAVLLCCPNLGLIECIGLSTKESSWSGYYQGLGFDVFVFNYRGYNDSQGVPSPDAIKADVLVLCSYLMQSRGVTRILVHGESIGGMAACHAARYCNGVHMLVCDRTFTSLDAAGCRILGNWAGFGLRLLCRWKTDVTTDYLHATCSKVILQDPNDEVIAYGATLKSGIATRLVLRDHLWCKRSLRQEYLIAFYSNAPLSTVVTHSRTAELIQLAESTADSSLSEEFIEHMAACILYVYKIALEAKTTPVTKDDYVNAEEGSDSQQLQLKSTYQSGKRERQLPQSHQASIAAIWLSLAKVDGGGGFHLGQVACKGFDSLRAWICDLIIWNAHTIGSTSTGIVAGSSLATCINEIEVRLLNHGSLNTSVTATDIDFLVKGLKIILNLVHKGAMLSHTYDTATEADTLLVGATSAESLGRVIPLNVGHNGWPSPLALAALSNSIKSAGIEIY